MSVRAVVSCVCGHAAPGFPFIKVHKKRAAFSAPICMKLTYAKQHYELMSCTNRTPNWAANVKGRVEIHWCPWEKYSCHRGDFQEIVTSWRFCRHLARWVSSISDDKFVGKKYTSPTEVSISLSRYSRSWRPLKGITLKSPTQIPPIVMKYGK